MHCLRWYSVTILLTGFFISQNFLFEFFRMENMCRYVNNMCRDMYIIYVSLGNVGKLVIIVLKMIVYYFYNYHFEL